MALTVLAICPYCHKEILHTDRVTHARSEWWHQNCYKNHQSDILRQVEPKVAMRDPYFNDPMDRAGEDISGPAPSFAASRYLRLPVPLPEDICATEVAGLPPGEPAQMAAHGETTTHHAQSMAQKRTKLRWSFLPWEALTEVVEVFGYGARKHSPRGWADLEPQGAIQDYKDAAQRHLAAMMQGEVWDAETGRLHAAHLACCALIVAYHQLKTTDRPKQHVP